MMGYVKGGIVYILLNVKNKILEMAVFVYFDHLNGLESCVTITQF